MLDAYNWYGYYLQIVFLWKNQYIEVLTSTATQEEVVEAFIDRYGDDCHFSILSAFQLTVDVFERLKPHYEAREFLIVEGV